MKCKQAGSEGTQPGAGGAAEAALAAGPMATPQAPASEAEAATTMAPVRAALRPGPPSVTLSPLLSLNILFNCVPEEAVDLLVSYV